MKSSSEVLAGEDWRVVEEAAGESGVMVIRRLADPTGTEPRNSLFRLRHGAAVTSAKAMARVPGSHRPAQQERQCTAVPLQDGETELVYNILRWYGTVVVDMRLGDVKRLAESLICPGVADLAKVPFRDDALVIGSLAAEAERVLRGRVARCVYTAGPGVVEPLLRAFQVLRAPPAQKREVLPNVVGERLAVGHQGHASKLVQWSKHLSIIGVINLAPNKVPSVLEAVPDEKFYHEVWHYDGMPLWDTVDDGDRFRDVLPNVLEAIGRALAAHPCGRVFIHCQQGRSRAASVAAAHLLKENAEWTLFEAVSFLAARRPETEINEAYARVLDAFAASLGRAPSLDRLRATLPRHLRPGGVARDWRDKMLDA